MVALRVPRRWMDPQGHAANIFDRSLLIYIWVSLRMNIGRFSFIYRSLLICCANIHLACAEALQGPPWSVVGRDFLLQSLFLTQLLLQQSLALCTHTHMHAHTQAHTHTHTYTHIHTRYGTRFVVVESLSRASAAAERCALHIYTRTFIYMSMYIYTYIHMSTYIYIHMNVYVYMYTHI